MRKAGTQEGGGAGGEGRGLLAVPRLGPLPAFLLSSLLLSGCASDTTTTAASAPARSFDPAPWADPFIGTGGHGHTFPGATVPFGMVQLSPDTRLEGWDGCSGYHHDDEFVYGFSHTHLSGTGCSDYGDVLFMPGVDDDVRWNNGADGKPGYRQHDRKRVG